MLSKKNFLFEMNALDFLPIINFYRRGETVKVKVNSPTRRNFFPRLEKSLSWSDVEAHWCKYHDNFLFFFPSNFRQLLQNLRKTFTKANRREKTQPHFLFQGIFISAIFRRTIKINARASY